MTLSKGLIKADIVAAQQAIEYFENNNSKAIIKMLRHIIFSRQQKS